MRYLLVIDDQTGQVLSYEEDLLKCPDRQAAQAVPLVVNHYVLDLSSSMEAAMP